MPLLPFIKLIFSKGNLTRDFLDFQSLRETSLKDLQSFLPDGYSSRHHENSLWKDNTKTANLVSSLSFIKNSIGHQSGHLEIPEKKLFYVRIPKAASTSMAYEILRCLKPEIKSTPFNSTQLNFLADAWLKAGAPPPQDYEGFTIVRNPFERLVSVYRDFFEHRNDNLFMYQNYLFGILTGASSFEEFVNRVRVIPDKLKDQHFKPQHLFLNVYRKRKNPVKVLKLERLPDLKLYLARFKLDLPHLNRSHRSYDYASYYNSETLQKAREVYHNDVREFEYEQEFDTLKSKIKGR